MTFLSQHPVRVLSLMKRCFLTLLFVSSPTFVFGQNSAAISTVSSSESSGTVLIYATDKQGAPVALSESFLAVHVDGQKVAITKLESAADVPMRFVLLLDLSGSDKEKLVFEKKAAAQIFESLSKDRNEGYLGAFTEEVKISTRPLRLSEVNAFLSQAQAYGGTALYDAIIKACDLLRDGPPAPSVRRVLFLVTDGEDNASRVPAAQAVKVALRDGVTIFSLRLLSSDPRSRGEKTLKKFARETSGAVLPTSSNTDIQKLLKPLDAQYFLTFSSPPPLQENTRELQVKSTDHSIEVFAPAAYSPK